MPRYFFHRTDGTRDVDHEGLELAGLEEARYEAVVFASDTLKDAKFALWDGGEVRIEVADDRHTVLFLIVLTAENVRTKAPSDEARTHAGDIADGAAD